MKNYGMDPKELFCMMVLFELGSAILFGLGADVKQDAWIAVFIGLIGGIFIYILYTALYKFSDNLTLTKFLRSLLGKYIGWTLGVIYVIYFIYIASRVLRDFVTLLNLAAYENSSYLMMAIAIMLCVMYASYQGLEVFGRFSVITFFLVMTSLSLIIILQISNGLFEMKNLQPVLEDGIGPVLKTALPTLVTVPYGELIVLLMILPQVQSSIKLKKVGIYAILLGGGILLLFTIMNIGVLGQDGLSRSSFPLLTSVARINIANFIQRIEFVVLFLLVLLGFIKIFVFTYCAILGSSDLFRMKKNTLIYPITFLVILSSVFIATTHSEHINEGLKLVPYYLHLPLQLYIPLLLLIVAWVKKRKIKSFKKPYSDEKQNV
ncbi:MAG: GerAB/ArcD/ProY family transporter [Bacillota bacterium]